MEEVRNVGVGRQEGRMGWVTGEKREGYKRERVRKRKEKERRYRERREVEYAWSEKRRINY